MPELMSVVENAFKLLRNQILQKCEIEGTLEGIEYKGKMYRMNDNAGTIRIDLKKVMIRKDEKKREEL